RPLRRAATSLAKVALSVAGLGPRVIGAENMPAGGAILAANHASYLDPFVLAATMPVDMRYVVKGECREVKFFGREIERLGYILMERFDAERSLADMKTVAGLVGDGQKVLI